MTSSLLFLINKWAYAVDHYHTEEARLVEKDLVPALLEAGAVDRRTAVVVDRFAYHVRTFDDQFGFRREVGRESIYAAPDPYDHRR